MALQSLGIVTDGKGTVISKKTEKARRPAMKYFHVGADMWDDKKGKQWITSSLPPDKGNGERD